MTAIQIPAGIDPNHLKVRKSWDNFSPRDWELRLPGFTRYGMNLTSKLADGPLVHTHDCSTISFLLDGDYSEMEIYKLWRAEHAAEEVGLSLVSFCQVCTIQERTR